MEKNKELELLKKVYKDICDTGEVSFKTSREVTSFLVNRVDVPTEDESSENFKKFNDEMELKHMFYKNQINSLNKDEEFYKIDYVEKEKEKAANIILDKLTPNRREAMEEFMSSIINGKAFSFPVNIEKGSDEYNFLTLHPMFKNKDNPPHIKDDFYEMNPTKVENTEELLNNTSGNVSGKDRYYTPEIEEFHIGFEYEQILGPYIKEDTSTHNYEKLKYNGNIHSISNWGLFKEIRVKYLDKEDIESFGFQTEDNGECYNKSIGFIIIGLYPWTSLTGVRHQYKIVKDSNQIFHGVIKNKSELKRILIQLGILNNQ